MSTTLRSLIISIALVIIAVFFFNISSQKKNLDQDSLQGYPAFVATDFQGKSYDKDGFLFFEINAENARFYRDENTFYVDNTNLFYFENIDGSLRSYQMTADKAKARPNDFASLTGNIKIFPNFDDSILKNISTNYLYYDLKKQIISSNEPIYIKGTNFENSGYNLNIDLNKKIIMISGEPHATFYPDSDM